MANNISQYMQKQFLDWCFAGAAATQPVGRFIGLATGSPTSAASSEIATGSGYIRSSMAFGAAGTPTSSGTVTNASAMTFGPFSSNQSISGLFISDTVSSAAGNQLWQGLLTTARTVIPGDSLVIASAALTVTLA